MNKNNYVILFKLLSQFKYFMMLKNKEFPFGSSKLWLVFVLAHVMVLTISFDRISFEIDTSYDVY